MIPFNKAYITGKELYYIAEAVLKGQLKGDGPFTSKCNKWLENNFNVPHALLTHSCTGALEMAAILLDLQEGDEVIMPSYTFVSTANAFLLRRAKPVFVDIRPDTLNIDETKIEDAITSNTRAICPVHYAGVGCEMDKIVELAKKYNLKVVEDAAHGIMAKYNGQYLGTIGDIGTFSFHETKNYSTGEGGAILLNDHQYSHRAEIIREKGTNRSQFFRGEIDKYTWVDVGSSYLPSEIIAAFLCAQLERAEEINQMRQKIWKYYYQNLQPLAESGYFRLPTIPESCQHNAHLFYILANSIEERTAMLSHLKHNGIGAVFHYVPLHTSPMGEMLGYKPGCLPITEDIADRIIRLPLFLPMDESILAEIVEAVRTFFIAAGKNNHFDKSVNG